jgi:uncharacterized protein (TIGR00255 family)
MKSMTGFGKGSFAGADFSLSVELRTVNNRFLDIHTRLPTELAALEGRFRKEIQSRLKRGRVDATVNFTQTREVRFEVNLPLVRGYVNALQQAREATGVDGTLDLSLIARLPGAIQPAAMLNGEFEARLADGLSAALTTALNALEAMRRVEGETLAEEIAQRVAIIADLLPEIEAASGQVVEAYRQKLERRMRELLRDAAALDESRLLQEAAYLADRGDITEETARLQSHVAQMRELIQRDDEAGKRMDFLLQEMNREANTMLSKTGDLKVSQAALAIKLEVEKIKEQAQNVE